MPAPSELSEAVEAGLLQPLLTAPQWIVGFSGGLDSTVLLHLCQRYLAQLRTLPQLATTTLPRLLAVHVDHQLMPDHSAWSEHCAAFCASHTIEYTCLQVEVTSTGRGIEQAARSARYEAFARTMQPASALLLAHHMDDQAETLLLRLFRGSGIRGAAAIARRRSFAQGQLLRPLLDFSRAALAAYARQHSLDYIDDPSNSDLKLDRNFVRHQVLPTITGRWPAVSKTLARFASHASVNDSLLTELAAIDAQALASKDNRYGENLRLDGLRALSPARRANLLRYWLEQQGWPMPSAAWLEQIDALARNARSAKAVLHDGFSVRVHRGGLYCVAATALATLEAVLASCPPWTGQRDIALGTTTRISLLCAAPAKAQQGLAAGRYLIGPRRRGASCRVNGMTKTVNKLLQGAGVPAWLRDAYPVIYERKNGDLLVAAVGDICIGDDYLSSDGAQLACHYHFAQAQRQDD
ncbi:MAG: tRNA lysidine(34) synthetase TilS [Pseudomonadales bacterium]|nr:tRNA lysidine(34) synthetase TilS [Pseudomonadales bacterium]